jgi:hypothetical protein
MTYNEIVALQYVRAIPANPGCAAIAKKGLLAIISSVEDS